MTNLGNPPINHIYREVNMVADLLVRNSDVFCNELIVFDQPPNEIVVNLLCDMVGYAQIRFVSTKYISFII